MAGISGSKFSLVLLALAVLPHRSWSQGDAPSAFCKLNIPPKGLSEPVVDCKINGTAVFNYSSCHAVEPVRRRGNELNATQDGYHVCDHMTELVKDLQDALLGRKQEIWKAFHSLILQVNMTCQRKSSASWEFSFSGKTCLLFDSENRNWTGMHSDCKSLIETSGNLLVVISKGFCPLLLHQSQVLDTKAAPITASAPGTSLAAPAIAAPTMAPGTAPVPVSSRATTITPTTWVLPLILMLAFWIFWT